jgi:hypothetical protein
MSGPGNHGHVVRDRDRWTPGRRHTPLSPRCGKPMLAYETANGPMLEEPECGRREGHPGPCRSSLALAREAVADVRRKASAVQPCACGCGETAVWGHRYRRGHNLRRADGAWAA